MSVLAVVSKDFSAWIKNRNTEESAYLIGIIILILSIVFPLDKSTSLNLLSFSSLVFAYGFGAYLIPEIISVSNSLIGKIVFSAALILGTAITHSFAGQIINLTLEVPSSPFVNTQTILTVLSTPLVFTIAFAFLGFFFIVLLVVNFGKVAIEPLLFMIRIIIYSTFWGFSFIVLNSYSEIYTEKLGYIAKLSAYHLESESFSFCKKQEGDKVAYIDSQNIIISNKNNDIYTFQTGVCVAK